MNLSEIIKRACEEKTLIDALAFACLIESERIVKQAKLNKIGPDGQGWDTCFKFIIASVMNAFEKKTKVISYIKEIKV